MTSGQSARLPYRRCVGAMLVNRDGRVFVGRRTDAAGDDGTWQMPQGGIDADEDPARAVLRELTEEIGTGNADIVAERADWLRYDFPEALIGKVLGGGYRGQEQKWFLLRFSGEESEIDLAAGSHAEFADWKWVAPEQVTGLVVPFKRAVYARVVAEFLPLIRGAATGPRPEPGAERGRHGEPVKP